MSKNKTRTLIIFNHPSNWIYRVQADKDFLIQRCEGEFSEVVNNKLKGWKEIKDAKTQASIYKYMLENSIDINYQYMD